MTLKDFSKDIVADNRFFTTHTCGRKFHLWYL